LKTLIEKAGGCEKNNGAGQKIYAAVLLFADFTIPLKFCQAIFFIHFFNSNSKNQNSFFLIGYRNYRPEQESHADTIR